MAVNFPDSPSLNDTFTSNGKTWTWDGTVWGAASVEHGSLAGLVDDDHTQYLLADGTRTATSLTASGDITSNGTIYGQGGFVQVGASSASEGGEIRLDGGTSYSGVYARIDRYLNTDLRFMDGYAVKMSLNLSTADLTVNGNIIVGGTVDGRDIAADGAIIDAAVTSSDVDDVVEISQASYDALGSGRPANRLYLITS